MKIKKVLGQNRNDFTAIMVCEFCDHEWKNERGYDDQYYHTVVIPGMVCENCGDCTGDRKTKILSFRFAGKDYNIVHDGTQIIRGAQHLEMVDGGPCRFEFVEENGGFWIAEQVGRSPKGKSFSEDRWGYQMKTLSNAIARLLLENPEVDVL